MCGIVGLIERPARAGNAELKRRGLAMARALIHRGPDRQGSWADEVAGIALGHARLSILDLSALGDQPMSSVTGRYVLSFNGEIYNFRKLRTQLESAGHGFRGQSDTEVLLAAFSEWGPRAALPRLDGMFAFALWDREERTLWLARDRMGEKPLYYGESKDGAFVFGSELKALRAYPGFAGEIDRESLRLYFDLACVPSPHSIYRGIRKLPPGTFLELRQSEGASRWSEPQTYWCLKDEIVQARKSPFQGTDGDAVQELERLLDGSIQSRRVSDVPLGAFLSGGIDSSLIVALMQKQSAEPVRTFTIGFEERDYNEADQARAVATHLGTSHSELILNAHDGLDAIPRLAQIYDEPFSDPSQLPTYLVARHARAQVTVCLSGDAGDELFSGYHRHFLADRLWDRLRSVPAPVRRALAKNLTRVPPGFWRKAAQLKPGGKPAIFADQVRKLIDVTPATSPRELYGRLLAHQRAPAGLVLGVGSENSALVLRNLDPVIESLRISEAFQYWDSVTYLPDDILTKVDRATMAVGLEARVPFLAPELIRFAWTLPPQMKIRDGEGKWILRRLLERHLPSELILRPKSGFRAPIGEWMRGGLRDWCENSLDERMIKQQGYLDPRQVRRLWQEHLSGDRDHEYVLWSLLMFQAWLAG